MKLRAAIDDTISEIEIELNGDRVVADLDGRKYELEVSVPEANVYLIKVDGKVFEAFVSPETKIGEIQAVSIGNHLIELRLIDPKRLRGTAALDIQSHGLVEIRSAMPGKVVRIFQSAGSDVSKGDCVMVVEAMKMQNELKSPQAGTVRDVLVSEGDTVTAGQILAVIE